MVDLDDSPDDGGFEEEEGAEGAEGEGRMRVMGLAGWRGMLGGASSSSSLAKAGSPARKDGSGTRSRSSSGSLTVAGSRGDERRFGLPGETYRSTDGRVARFNVGLVVRIPPLVCPVRIRTIPADPLRCALPSSMRYR